jgi:HSP20 family protein
MTGLTLREWAPPSLRSLFRSWDEPWSGMPSLLNEADLPVDISKDKEGRVVVRATLPGFKKDEINVRLENNSLNITAEHNEESESKGEDYYRRERSWKSVNRTVALPGQADKDGVDAELKDGVLTVRVQQAKEAKSHSIKVN